MALNDFVESDGHQLIKAPIRSLNKKILKEIIEASFRELLVENYFPFLIENDAVVYLEAEYLGLAIIIPRLKHLKTLAVHPKYWRNGLGPALFNAVSEDHRKLNLCSRGDRIANEKLYEGLVEEGILEEGNPFFRKDMRVYKPYYLNHTEEEKNMALAEMRKQPVAFKNNFPNHNIY